MLALMFPDKSIKFTIDSFKHLFENSLNNYETSKNNILKLQTFNRNWLIESISNIHSINSFKDILIKSIN
jgi:hypothetical protein